MRCGEDEICEQGDRAAPRSPMLGPGPLAELFPLYSVAVAGAPCARRSLKHVLLTQSRNRCRRACVMLGQNFSVRDLISQGPAKEGDSGSGEQLCGLEGDLAGFTTGLLPQISKRGRVGTPSHSITL